MPGLHALAAALREARLVLGDEPAELRPGAAELVDDVLRALDKAAPDNADKLAGWLVDVLAASGHRAATPDLVGLTAGHLAPRTAAWNALLTALDQLGPGHASHHLGRLPFVTDGRLARLVDESRRQQPATASPGQYGGRPGEELANLAVSRQLKEAVSDAVGSPLKPCLQAVYLYDPPASHVRPHVDRGPYDFVVHLVLEHTKPPNELPNGSAGSALLVHRAHAYEPDRIEVGPGEAVLLCGRGVVHEWEPLHANERRTLTAIGFTRAAG